jgi:hypothetical protein
MIPIPDITSPKQYEHAITLISATGAISDLLYAGTASSFLSS